MVFRMKTTLEQAATPAGGDVTLHSAEARPPVDCVLFLCPAYDSRYPSETMWQRLRALSRLGKVHVLPIYPSPTECLEPPAGAAIVEPGRRRWSQSALFGYPGRIKRFAGGLAGQANNGVIWYNSNLFTRTAARAAARLTGWPVVADVWDVPDLPMWSQHREGRRLKSLAHRMMGFRLARHLEAAELVVWSLHPAATSRYFSAHPAKLLLLPNGIRWNVLRDCGLQCDHPSPATAARSCKLLYMGHFRQSRGSALLVETISRLRHRADVELHLVGEVSSPPAREAIQRIPEAARSLIRFHGHLPWASAMNVVDECDICLYPFPHCPELEHIYPLKLLEYAALNKWIISSDLAGARRLLGGYEKVRWLDPSKPEQWAAWAAWAAQATKLAAMPPAEFRRRCDDSMIADYDWDLINRKLLERATKLLASLPRAR